MPDLLLELFSEEIPAHAAARRGPQGHGDQPARGCRALYEGATSFATPRRLALAVQGIPARQPDLREEKKGPRVGAPEAVEGFLKGTGLASLDQATVQKDPKKGGFYVALVEKPARPAVDVLAEMLPVVIRTFPWPKSMRWGSGKLTWVRPLRSSLRRLRTRNRRPGPRALLGRGDRGRRHHARAPVLAPDRSG